MAGKKRKTIGLLVDWANTPYQLNIMAGIEAFARQNNYFLIKPLIWRRL